MRKLLIAAVLAAFTGSALMVPTVTFAASTTDTQVAQAPAPKKEEMKKKAPAKKDKKAPVKKMKKGEEKKKS